MEPRNRVHGDSDTTGSHHRAGQPLAANWSRPVGRFRFSYDDDRQQAVRQLRAMAAARGHSEEQRQRIRAATRC